MSRRWQVVAVALLVAVVVWVATLIAPSRSQGVDAYVGVSLRNMSAQEAAYFGLRAPAVVAVNVVPNGPAYKAGLRDGDAITSVDGQEVSDAKGVVELVRAHKAGDKVRMGIVMGDGRRLAIELGIVAEPRPPNLGFDPTQPSRPSGTPPPPAGAAQPGGAAPRLSGALRLVDPQTAMQGIQQRQRNCSALVPQGWTMTVGQYSDTADISGAGGRARALWGIRGINTAQQMYQGAMFGPPDVATLATVSFLTGAPARYTAAPTGIGGYFVGQSFEAGNVVGTTLYHAYPLPQETYILSLFMAWVDRSATNLLPTAQAVMVSINCQTQLRPVETTFSGSRPGARGGAESDKLKDYNVQLGTQWAHSSTGQHFLLDYATQWNDTGPDGPGYYIKSGNSHEKLTPGW
jgi:PDZ domain-containing protein